MHIDKFWQVAAALAGLLMGVGRAGAVSPDFYGRDAATVGIHVVDIASGRVIAQENASKAMIPASTLKCVTAAASLMTSGADSRYTTVVDVALPDADGRSHGHLRIHGSADPTIDSKHFEEYLGFSDSIIVNLQRMGVGRIDGYLDVIEDRFTQPGQIPQWVIEDTGWDYGAAPYGFNWRDNVFTIMTGLTDMPTDPINSYIDVELIVEGDMDILRGINSSDYVIMGKNLLRRDCEVVTTMNHPADVFAENFELMLEQAGIAMDYFDVDDDGRDYVTVYEHLSPPNIEILRHTMTMSDNMMAEATLRNLAPGESRQAAIAREKAVLDSIGVSTEFAKIFDGSGLARADRVTPKMMTDLLVAMAKGDHADEYVSLFPIAGVNGTVKNLLKGTSLKGKVVAKSGSMNGVHCYAGYRLDDAGSPKYAFVIMVNNFFCQRADLRKAIERWMLSTLK